MLATNKFSMDINVLGYYSWETKIVLIFSLSTEALTDWSEYYAEIILIYSRNIHTKIKLIQIFFTAMRQL